MVGFIESGNRLAKQSGIRPRVIEEIRTLAYHVEKMILFGARARGDFKRTSDIDLAVEGGEFTRFALDIEEEKGAL